MQKAVIKKLVSVVAALSITTAIFAGCASNNNNGATDNSATGEASPAAAASSAPAADASSAPAADASSAPAADASSAPAAETKLSGDLYAMSFTDEFKGIIAGFNKKNPDVKIKFEQVPNESYASKLTTKLQSGSGVPDVFTTEVKYLKRFADKGYLEDLTNPPYNAGEILSGQTKYVQDLSKNAKGQIVGLSWQATPGGIFYRKDLAKEMFNIESPEDVQEKVFKNYETIYAAAKTIKEKSGGKKFLFPDANCMSHFYLANVPWVKDGKLVIDDKLNTYIDGVKKFRDEGLDGRMGEWSAGWSGAMSTDKVMGYPGPSWLGFYAIQANGKDKSKGKYGLVEGPAPYWWGGSWAHIYAKSEKKDLAWAFIKFFTSDEEFLINTRAKELGDFVPIKTIQNKLANDTTFGDAYLGGQNTYKTYLKTVDNIDGTIVSAYDDDISARFNEALASYVNGKIKREDVIPNFKKDIKTRLGSEVKVD